MRGFFSSLPCHGIRIRRTADCLPERPGRPQYGRLRCLFSAPGRAANGKETGFNRSSQVRYRIGTEPGAEGYALDQGAFISIAVLSLLMGFGFIYAGLKSRHYWLTLWGSGLSLSSVAYLLYLALRL